MARALRFVLVLFLVLAVPLQGLAGTTMAACAAAHGGNAMAHATADGHGHEMAHDHGEDMAHDHAAMGHGAFAAEGVAASEGEHAAHACPSCSACCSVSAVAVPAFAFAGAGPAPSLAIPFLERVRRSVSPDGLERPPSTLKLG